MEANAVILNISEAETISEKLTKRSLKIRTIEEYPQTFVIDFFNDKATLLDVYKTNDIVSVSARLSGREIKNKDTGEKRIYLSLIGQSILHYGQEQTTGDYPF